MEVYKVKICFDDKFIGSFKNGRIIFLCIIGRVFFGLEKFFLL